MKTYSVLLFLDKLFNTVPNIKWSKLKGGQQPYALLFKAYDRDSWFELIKEGSYLNKKAETVSESIVCDVDSLYFYYTNTCVYKRNSLIQLNDFVYGLVYQTFEQLPGFKKP